MLQLPIAVQPQLRVASQRLPFVQRLRGPSELLPSFAELVRSASWLALLDLWALAASAALPIYLVDFRLVETDCLHFSVIRRTEMAQNLAKVTRKAFHLYFCLQNSSFPSLPIFARQIFRPLIFHPRVCRSGAYHPLACRL